MIRALAVGMALVFILVIAAIISIENRRAYDTALQDETANAREMTFLVCSRALPYVMGGSQGVPGATLTFNTISTNETGGYKILLCLKK
jgi:hypothetical protein